VSFIKPCFSKLSSSPTKIGEYLASGLPIVTNRGIGDVDELILRKRVGVLVDSFDGRAYRKALEESLSWLGNGKDLRGHCQQVANEEFSLDLIGRRRYRQVYDRVAGEPSAIVESDGVAVGGNAR
jgi:glycosyltransferase involved in cell wall biosynthesis